MVARKPRFSEQEKLSMLLRMQNGENVSRLGCLIPGSHDDAEVKRCVRTASYCSQLVAESRAGPDCVTRLGQSSLIKLTYGRRLRRLHQYPACGGRGLEGETRL
ncbi:MAG: hypothetical protein EOQ28_32745 [Mesorhizobium sp.]|nr:MAG: hypothetical protein EOQ28_32745 [Mesorhizobium sp.]